MHGTEQKYEWTGLTREFEGRLLHQIRAVRALELSSVAVGDLGGWIEREANLSHAGECWVYPDACILEEAVVEGDCRIADRAVVRGRARLSGFILMNHDSQATDDVVLEKVCQLTGDTLIYGSAVISCGEDGPQILPGIQIDFDVSYGQRYATFGTAYNGYLAAVSAKGRICMNATYHSPRWSGTVAELPTWINGQIEDDPEVKQLVRFIELYLA